MKTKPEPEGRTYHSDLRADQARATRERVLDAAIERLRAGDREMSYAAIAREARVSVPTVYRHFPTRQDLFDAVFARTETAAPPSVTLDKDTMHESVRSFFSRFDDPDGVHARATRLNTIWEFSRATTVPRRRAWCEAFVDERFPGLAEPRRTWVVDLCVVLMSSAMAEAFRGYLDRSGSETADRVGFALDALFAHVATLLPPESE